MCSRQVFADGNQIAEAMGLEVENSQDGCDNSAPTDLSPVITLQDPKKLQYFKWGFPWIDRYDKKILTTCIRSETVLKTYGRLLTGKKRCLSVSKGFYEFSKVMKEPFFFTVTDQPYTLIAALYDYTPELTTGEYQNRYAILTTYPNDMVSKTHDRMPVILTVEGQTKWLNESTPLDELLELLLPYDENKMDVKIASKKLNSSKNKKFKLDNLIDPTDRPSFEQGSLF